MKFYCKDLLFIILVINNYYEFLLSYALESDFEVLLRNRHFEDVGNSDVFFFEEQEQKRQEKTWRESERDQLNTTFDDKNIKEHNNDNDTNETDDNRPSDILAFEPLILEQFREKFEKKLLHYVSFIKNQKENHKYHGGSKRDAKNLELYACKDDNEWCSGKILYRYDDRNLHQALQNFVKSTYEMLENSGDHETTTTHSVHSDEDDYEFEVEIEVDQELITIQWNRSNDLWELADHVRRTLGLEVYKDCPKKEK